jgi:hypothetical protein
MGPVIALGKPVKLGGFESSYLNLTTNHFFRSVSADAADQEWAL